MSYQAKIKRYLQILQLIEKSKYPSISLMLDSINDSGLKVSDRQLKRDLESLRFEFGIDIQYSAYQKGYHIKDEDFSYGDDEMIMLYDIYLYHSNRGYQNEKTKIK